MTDTYLQQSIKTWDTIADSFDKTRKNPWNQVIDFISTLSTDSKVIDLGSGNGRHLLPAAQHSLTTIGVDFSRRMLEITQQKTTNEQLENTENIQANLYTLPFKSKSFDAGLCVAALHNVKTRTLRQQCIKEIYRILRPNGKVLISVWSRDQDRFKNRIAPQDNNSESGDIDVYWQQDGFKIPRFYHLYNLKEFREDIQAGGFIIQSMEAEKIASKIEADNYFAIALKRE
jgi:ubiquinone/menaquinone biosynthesis C-methylase UbiE